MKKIGYPNFPQIIILCGVLIILFGCASLKAKQEGTVTSSPPGATVYFQEAITNKKMPIGRTPTYAWARQGIYDFLLVAELEGYETERWLIPKSGPISYHFQLTKRREGIGSAQIKQEFEQKEITRIVQKESADFKEPQEVRINLEEGDFVIKGLAISKERYGSPKLKGKVLNNTSKNWKVVTFQTNLFDSLGNKVKPDYLGDTFTFRIFDIKKGEEKPIGILGDGEYLSGLKNISIAKIEVQFKEGEYPAKYNFILIKPKENRELSFDDNTIRILFSISKKQISFVLQNKTDQPIKIDWNQVSYVDVLGESHRVMHSGSRYIERDKPQAPTIIPPTARIQDIVFPTDYVYYTSGKYGGWTEIPLFPEAPKAKLFKGKTISVFMPLDIGGVAKNYLFTFKIEGVEM